MNLKKTIWAVIAMALGLLPNAVWVITSPLPMNAFKLGLAPSLALIAGLVAWSGRRPAVAIACLLPFSILVPLESYYIWNFQSPSSVHVIGIISETNFREAREYIGDNSLIFLTAVSLLSFLFVLLALQRVGISFTFPKSRAWRWVGLAALFPVFSLIAFESSLVLISPNNQQPSAWGVAQSQQYEIMLHDVNLKISDVMSPGFPFGVPLRAASYIQERKRLSQAKETIDSISVQANNRTDAADQAVVVLVIGESANSLNWGVNGYERDTTPQISALPGGVSMRNVITPWNATRLSVPVILTGQQDPVSGLSPLDVPSVISIFRASGWKTYWLSNQSPLGEHDSSVGLYASQADVVRYVNVADFTSNANNDDVLLEPMMRSLKFDPAPRKLIVVHLLGSHAEYHFRYPSQFNRFQPSGTDSSSPGELKTLMNSYDNSILFTDHILAEITNFLQKSPDTTNTSLVYVSDHGQALPTYDCPQWGHSHIAETTYRVPGFVWMSSESQRRHAGALERLKASLDKPLHTNQIFDTIIDLAQIETSGMNPQKSWINAAWQPSKRMVRTGVDFDSIVFSGACRVAVSQIDRQ